MRLVKKYWRLILGLSFVFTGLSEFMAQGTWSGYGVFALGCCFVVWHAVALLLKHHGRGRDNS